MTAISNFKFIRIRSTFLFGLGAHLAVNGLLLLAIYYLVMKISAQHAEEVMVWLIPTAQGCCMFAAILFTAGLSFREPRALREEPGFSCGWLIGKIVPIGRRESRTVMLTRAAEGKPPAVDVERTLCLLKGLDWKVFKSLGTAYFRELGFRVVDEPDRANGVDFLLYTDDDYSAVAVRCLPWGTERVDLKQVRHAHRAMLLAGAGQGVMLTTGFFDEEAIEFGEDKPIELLGGESFATRLLSLPSEASERLLREAAAAESVRRGQTNSDLEESLFKSS